jgi:hypothetical protein
VAAKEALDAGISEAQGLLRRLPGQGCGKSGVIGGEIAPQRLQDRPRRLRGGWSDGGSEEQQGGEESHRQGLSSGPSGPD